MSILAFNAALKISDVQDNSHEKDSDTNDIARMLGGKEGQHIARKMLPSKKVVAKPTEGYLALPAKPEDNAELNFAWAAMLIDGLVAAGATNIVMSPGAQMAPLSLAARSNEDAKISIIIDERSAAFYALGQARATGKPTILICTSGSAVGHWYPAVMEASAGLTPLILLTADRAPENQDRCSAQAIDQIRVFGPYVRAFHNLPLPDSSIDALSALSGRVYEQSVWPCPGPVHVNMPFREPLFAKARKKRPQGKAPIIGQTMVRPRLEEIDAVAQSISGRPGVIVCGSTELDADFATAVEHLARAAGCPVLADPLSGIRFGVAKDSHVIARGDSLTLSKAFAANCRPEWVISFGGPPTSKNVLTWLQGLKVSDYIVVDNTVRWPDPLRLVTHLVRSYPASFCRGVTSRVTSAPASWMAAFRAYERDIDTLAAAEAGSVLWEAPILRRLLAVAARNGIVFSGNSMSVRDFDTFSGTTDKHVRLLANRGTNGIDGSVSTLLGIAATQKRTTVSMIGDMAFSHDVGSLQLGRSLDVILVVLNNGGGAIFDYLPSIDIPEYEDFLSPPQLQIGSVAKACGWRHWRVDTLEALDAALLEAKSYKGARLIEAVIDRKVSVASHKAFWKNAAALDIPFEIDYDAGL